MKNIDLILRTMAETALESRKNSKRVQGNNAVINQLYATVEAAAITQHAQRHNKMAVNEIFDRSSLFERPTKEEELSVAAKKLARQSHKKRS